jgi:hypothetical protein
MCNEIEAAIESLKKEKSGPDRFFIEVYHTLKKK